MLRNILIIFALFVAAHASGQLSILNHPKSLVFKGNEKLNADSLADVFAASLGYSIEHPSEWTGLIISDPFNTATGVITLVVDGIENIIADSPKAISYGIVGTGSQESLDSLIYRVQEHNSVAVDVDLSQGMEVLDQYNSLLGDFKPQVEKTVSSLKPQTHSEDKLFLEQISVINELADKLATLEELPTFINIHLSVTPLIAAHTLSSPAMTDVLKLLSAAAQTLVTKAEKSYDKNVVVAVVAINDDLSRTKRALTTKSDPITDTLNLAHSYSTDYPVIFNIILWFGVVLTFTLLAISYSLAYMDPGRDSIIYRMTSNRIKKDI